MLLDGEDEKPPLPPRLASTSTSPASETPTDRYKVSVWNYLLFSFLDKQGSLAKNNHDSDAQNKDVGQRSERQTHSI